MSKSKKWTFEEWMEFHDRTPECQTTFFIHFMQIVAVLKTLEERGRLK